MKTKYDLRTPPSANAIALRAGRAASFLEQYEAWVAEGERIIRALAADQEIEKAKAEAVERIRAQHARKHVATTDITYCGASDGISATYCEIGILLHALGKF